MSWKIVADSGCDFRQLTQLTSDLQFESVPLTIQVENTVYTDDANLDIDQMMQQMEASKQASKSACPSPDDYLNAYKGADKIFVLTITGALSGSQNAAQVAKGLLLEENPHVQIHVIDTLSAGGEIDLLVLKLQELIQSGLSFEEVKDAIRDYQTKTKLLFVLASVQNLVKNGRLSKAIGAVIGLLNVRMVGEASAEGKLELLKKARGYKKSVSSSIDAMLEAGYKGGRIVIAHRNNEKFCQDFSEKIRAHFPQAIIDAIPTSGLCSFYAEEAGLLMGYEI